MDVAAARVEVSVILVSYNTRELTRQCLASLLEKTGQFPYDVWVVDNNSRDGSAAMIRESFPQIHLLENRRNLGFGPANNCAIRKSQGKYCFLLNTDTVVLNNAVAILYQFMESRPDVGACGGYLCDGDGRPASSCGYIPTIETMLLRKTPLKLFMPGRNRALKRYEQELDRNQRQPVGFIVGADLFLRRSALQEIGLFDERFFLYFEETELQHRLSRAGWGIWFVPEAQIVHFAGRSDSSAQRHVQFQRSLNLYYRICYGPFWGGVAQFLYFRKYRKRLRASQREKKDNI